MISYLYLQDFDQDGNGASYQEPDETQKTDHFTKGGPSRETNLTETSKTKAPSLVGTDEVPYNNPRVYMAADKFGIDPLRDLARERLASWLKCIWDKEAFPLVVRSVFQSLPLHESQIPDVVADLMSEKAENLLKQELVLDLLEEFGGVTIAVLREVAGYFRDSEVERERLAALCEPDSFENTLVSKLNRISRCKHYQAAFSVRVDISATDFGTVRCGSCRTRH